MNERINDKVKLWLEKMPLRDNPTWQVAQDFAEPITWEDWISEGKGIAGVEESLLRLLESEDDPVTRSLIVVGLGVVGGDVSVNPLIRILESDESMVAKEAAAALGGLGDPAAVEPLCAALGTTDINVRASAAMALGQLGGKRAVECLKSASEDENRFVRSAIREALRGHTGGSIETDNVK